MANRVLIDCVEKDPRLDEHHAIQFVGGPNPGGKRWRLTIDEAVQGALAGKWQFYTSVNGREADVFVRRAASNHLYLTTSPDGYKPNNLLNLTACSLRSA